MRVTLCALAFLASAPALATGAYDGVWFVQGSTDVGSCPKTFSGEITIRDGAIAAANEADVKAIGAIDAKGEVWSRFTRNDGVARASGRMRERTASGAWSSSTAHCGGRWSATKR